MPDRIIRASALISPTLDALSDGAERMWWRLTVVADDHGRFDADPRVVWARCFPLKDKLGLKIVTKWIDELEASGLIRCYRVDGYDHTYGAILRWSKYQRPPRLASKFPDPPNDISVPAERFMRDLLCDSIVSDGTFYGYSIASVDRNVRAGGGYADLVLMSTTGGRVLIELKRTRADRGALKQIVGYRKHLSGVAESVIIATGIGPSLSTEDFRAAQVSLIVYDESGKMTLLVNAGSLTDGKMTLLVNAGSLTDVNSQIPDVNSQRADVNSQIPAVNSHRHAANSHVNSQIPDVNSHRHAANSQLCEETRDERREARDEKRETRSEKERERTSLAEAGFAASAAPPDKRVRAKPPLDGQFALAPDGRSVVLGHDLRAQWEGTYPGLDLDRELRKMLAWCDANKRRLTKRRAVNWLNRASDDLPVQARASPAGPSLRDLDEARKRIARVIGPPVPLEGMP